MLYCLRRKNYWKEYWVLKLVRIKVDEPKYVPDHVVYPDNLWVDLPDGVIGEVFDGVVTFDGDEPNSVAIPEWAFAKFVEVWQKERAGLVPAERWVVEYRSWKVNDGTEHTNGWEVEAEGFSTEGEAWADARVRQVAADSFFMYTRAQYRARKVA